jgi:uncharacterized protein YcbK (DUF882 family)
MTIRAVGTASTQSAERSSSRVDDTNAEQFAGMFTTAMHASHKAERARPKDHGTSELDRTKGKEEGASSVEEKSENEKKTKRRAHVRETAVSTAITSLAALDPELQAKLARVMSRMQNESGKTVTVTETFRTQDRQNMLFAQGRQAPGDVVTWTQNSKHTQGRAVDVIVDGGGADAYQLLQRIANEEGLRTLGAIDPGHLELQGNGPKLSVDANTLIPAAPADANGPGQSQLAIARLAQLAPLATVAPVAQVAQVAQVAPVAHVAAVAQAGQTDQAGQGTRTGQGTQAAPTTASSELVANAARSHAHAGNGAGNGAGESDGAFGGSQDDSADAKGSSHGYAAFAHGLSAREHASAFSVPMVAAAAGSDAAARTEQLMQLMDATPARQLSSLTMSIDNGNGTSDHIQLSMRGASLDTTIATADDRVAQLLTAKSDELAKALNKDGIELRELRVRAAGEASTVTSAAASQSSHNSGDASSQSRFDRGQSFQRQQDQQDQYDRQRSQQQQRGRQQRQWRGANQ